MRLCRYRHKNTVHAAFYLDDRIVPVNAAAQTLGVRLPTPDSADLLDYLPPHGKSGRVASTLWQKFTKLTPAEQTLLGLPLRESNLRVPIPAPRKVLLLAGNYAAHVVEQGGVSAERQETFPYFFWKPPSTTLTNPGQPIRIPKVSPSKIDWELELGVVIGKACRHVAEKDALTHVAGYTVCNDVSDRGMKLKADRKQRDRDAFFDWLHGKWHDTFLPMGPCLRAAATLPDPQNLRLTLKVNGQVMQDATTAQMVFPVAALISTLSSWVTLEPGDIIVTGTPQGVGHARKPPVYLKPGDEVVGEIEGIGVLRNPVALEE